MTATLRKSSHATLRPVIYARISQDRTGAGVKVAAQVADAQELREQLNLPAADILRDNDLSAYNGKPRPGYDELLAGLRSGRWNALIVWHVDRMYRDMYDLVDIVDACEQGHARVFTVRGGEIDLTTPEGRMSARVLGVLSRYESEHRADRVVNGSRGTRKRAALGRDNGGARVYGFRCLCPRPHVIIKFNADGDEISKPHVHLTDEQIDAEVKVVQELTQRLVDGESARGLAADLRQRQVPTPRGGSWTASGVKDLIIRPRNVGLRDYKGKILRDDVGEEVRSVHDAIVERGLWDAARALLATPKQPYYGKAAKHLMSGNALCWCGGGIRGGAAEQYRGAACSHIKRKRADIDRVVVQYVLAYLSAHDVAGCVPGTPAADMRDEIEATRREVEAYEDAICGDRPPRLANVSEAGLQRKLKRLQAELARLEREQALNVVPDVLAGVTAESWAELPIGRRRAVVRELVIVRLLPLHGKRHHDGAVEIVPRAA